MKSAELRIGNLVAINGRGVDCIYQVTSIDQDTIDAKCINRCDPFKEVYNEPLGNVRPIELNDKLNTQLGFTWSNHVDGYRRDYIELTLFMDLMPIDDGQGYAVHWDYNWLCSTSYAHIVQNIYYALTGQELTILT